LKKLAAFVLGGLLLTAVPAIADQASRAAPVSEGFLTIGGPKRLEPQATLRVPIRCSVECSTRARSKLHLPDTEIPPSTATGHLLPGKPRNLIVTLNEAATETIRTQSAESRLRVGVTAVDESSDERVHAVKVFKFESPSP
jgi:hypothetical protein